MHEFELVEQLRFGLSERLQKQSHSFECHDESSEELMLKALVYKLFSTKSCEDAWQAVYIATGQLPSYKQVNELQIFSCIALDPDQLLKRILEIMVVARGLAGLAPNTEVLTQKNVIVVESSHLISLSSGIQRVTRLIAKSFESDPSFVLVSAMPDGSGFTVLTELEKDHLLQAKFAVPDEDLSPNNFPTVNLILSNCQVVIPEVTKNIDFASRLRAMGAYSNNEIFFIGYDLIPILAPEYVAPIEVETFAHYLLATTESTGVMCISDQTKDEFAGYLRARKTVTNYEGELMTLPLPVEQLENLPSNFEQQEFQPLLKGSFFLCVGTIEPRKNQRKVIAAFKTMWAKGEFNQIVFVGRIATQIENDFIADVNQELGTKIFHFTDLDLDSLNWLYENCLSTIQVSDYEGFGLPVVESISHGKPVIVNPFGVQFELAYEKGGLAVADSSVNALAIALEQISKDEELVNDLVIQARNARFPTVDDYAKGIVKVLNKES